MLHYRIYRFLLLELTVWKTFQSNVFQMSIERVALKAQSILLIFERQL